MESGNRRANASLWPAAFVLAAALIAAATYGGRGEAAAPAQDLTRIESRLGQLEQRLYTIESGMRGLEQQSRLAGINAGRPALPDPEVNLLRTELNGLRLRLAEVECGLARVDERTLSAQAREARRRAQGAAAEPCRLNADAPLRLPSQP
jgi:hypothetical protein